MCLTRQPASDAAADEGLRLPSSVGHEDERLALADEEAARFPGRLAVLERPRAFDADGAVAARGRAKGVEAEVGAIRPGRAGAGGDDSRESHALPAPPEERDDAEEEERNPGAGSAGARATEGASRDLPAEPHIESSET